MYLRGSVAVLVGSTVLAAACPGVISRPRVALPPASHLSKGWRYSGCYKDDVSDRALPYRFIQSQNNTGEGCITWCTSNGYPYAGTEWSQQCFCGLDGSDLEEADASECNMGCKGNSSQACGGPSRLSVYTGGRKPEINEGDGKAFTYLGCFPDQLTKRTLPSPKNLGNNTKMTVEGCVNACHAAGFISTPGNAEGLAGLEYGRECWCGLNKNLPSPILGKPQDTGCNTPCQGELTEYCGGANRLNVYVVYASSRTPTIPPTNTSSNATSLPPAPTPTPVTNEREIIVNGGFEYQPDIHSGWTLEPEPGHPPTEQLGFSASKAPAKAAHSGQHAAIIYEKSSEINGTRSLCFAQSAYHPSEGWYYISAYIGRLRYGGAGVNTTRLIKSANSTTRYSSAGVNNTTRLIESANSTTRYTKANSTRHFVEQDNSVGWQFRIDDLLVAGGDVCGQGICTAAANDGALIYKKETYSAYITEKEIGWHKLAVCAIYSGNRKALENVFLVDDVSILRPVRRTNLAHPPIVTGR